MTQKYLLGFDIGGTKCAAILGAIRDGGEPEPLSRTQFATRECATPGECIEKLCRLGLEALRQAGRRPGDLHGVGISCGGPLDSRRGIIHLENGSPRIAYEKR